MIVRNEDVKEIRVEIPKGHRHLRTTIVFKDGTELTFQEATIANLVRAYTTVKTHPIVNYLRLVGKKIKDKKKGYAEWQLVEI